MQSYADAVLVNVIGVIAGVITAAQVLRQVSDILAVRRPVGVSWVTWELALVQSIGLGVLSVAKAYLAAAVINCFVGVASIFIIGRLLAGRRPGLAGYGTGVAVVGATLAAGLAGLTLSGSRLDGTVGAVASAFVWVPQAVRSVRTRSPAGLSWAFALAGIVSSALWGTYAILLGEWRLLVPPVSAIVALAITAAFALWHARAVQPTAGSPVASEDEPLAHPPS